MMSMTCTLMAGAAEIPITPPLEVGILMSSVQRRWEPFERVSLPLMARALTVACHRRRVALVSLDLLGVSLRAFGRDLCRRIAAASRGAVAAGDVILAATHTHSAPESLALTNLYRTAPFRRWSRELVGRIGTAIHQACRRSVPCTLWAGSTRAPGLAIHRRIRTTRGIVLSHPPPPRRIVISRKGPVDDRVTIMALRRSGGELMALLVNAACHPVHEMCLRTISPDYPGYMSLELQRRHPGSAVLFFNGAAGNINPPTVSGGAAAARRHGLRLAQQVDAALARLRPVQVTSIELKRRTVNLPARSVSGRPRARPLGCALAALRLGSAAMVFVAGEPFVESGLAIRGASPFSTTAVVGYAMDYIGYIPTDQAFDEGGYETGPGLWSIAARGSAPIVANGAIELLRESVRTGEVPAGDTR